MSTTPDLERLGFVIDGKLKRWTAGGVMSATSEEQALWAEVQSLRASANTCGPGAGCLHKDALLDARDVEIESLRAQLEAAQQSEASALALVARMRQACGDNGARMQDDLEQYLRGLAIDAERWRWMKGNANWRWQAQGRTSAAAAAVMQLTFSQPAGTALGQTPEAVIDAARKAEGAQG